MIDSRNNSALKHRQICRSARMCVCGTNQEDDVSVEVYAKLNAVDDFLSSPTRNPKVGNQSHNRHSEEPEGDK